MLYFNSHKYLGFSTMFLEYHSHKLGVPRLAASEVGEVVVVRIHQSVGLLAPSGIYVQTVV